MRRSLFWVAVLAIVVTGSNALAESRLSFEYDWQSLQSAGIPSNSKRFVSGTSLSSLSSRGLREISHLQFLVLSGQVDSVMVNRSEPFSVESAKIESEHAVTTFSGDDIRGEDYYRQAIDTYSMRDREINPAQIIESKTNVGGKELLTVGVKTIDQCQPQLSATGFGKIALVFYGSDDLQVEQITDARELMQLAAEESRDCVLSGSAAKVTGDSYPEYLIITNDDLAPAFQPLLRWKSIKGLASGIIRMNQVLAISYGVDDAEKLRNFLIEMYNNGTRYVLLGGDETVVPVRYAFPSNTTSMPTLDILQLCDLYYGDVNGNWDVDGDGVYGEPTQDSPDLNAELLVGRLPVCTPAQVTDYVSKLITYEQNPHNGDYAYLNKSLFVAADQMRDYGGGVGQHTLLAQSMPAQVISDTTDLIEAPTGFADNPSYPLAANSTAKLGDGWGIISLLIHGRGDGWIIRSNQYNQWPKSFILTATGTDDGHGYMSNIRSNGMPGLVYSVGCNNGAFDLDLPPFPSANPTVATAFLTKPDGGAVVFVGYSRWGWVTTSWQIEQAFLDYLYNTNANPAEALRYVKLQYSYYRDECYGLNLDGDPEMKIWTTLPQTMTLSVPQSLPAGAGEFEVTVRSGSTPVAGALVSVVKNDSIATQLLTDASGKVTMPIEYSVSDTFKVYAFKAGYATATQRLNPQLVLGTDDDVQLPKAFEVFQNYPNPFNPATTIAFQTDRTGDVTLEIFNILGEKVKTAMAEPLAAGRHEVSWDGSDDSGVPVSSGVYFARIRTEDQSAIVKMCLMK